METILWIFGVIAVVFVLILIGAAAQGAEQRKIADEALTQLRETYRLDEAYVSPFGSDCIALNWDERRLYGGKAPDAVVSYTFEQLRSSEIELDGVTVSRSDGTTKTRRGAQLGGAAVGGLVFGPAGLLVGGLTGGSKTTSISRDTENVCSIGLVLRFHDRTNPIQKILFWDMGPPGIERHNAILKPIIANANRFHALMVQIIEDQAAPAESQVPADFSERLERLWALHQAGALSEAEFDKQKRALLKDQ